jgi:hypothetical protein
MPFVQDPEYVDNAVGVLLQGDDVCHGFFTAIIGAHDELKFDTQGVLLRFGLAVGAGRAREASLSPVWARQPPVVADRSGTMTHDLADVQRHPSGSAELRREALAIVGEAARAGERAGLVTPHGAHRVCVQSRRAIGGQYKVVSKPARSSTH